MTVTVKNKTEAPLVVPVSVRRKAGHRNGEDLEFRVSGGVITILPKRPSADAHELYRARTAACTIDAQLAGGLADIKAGRTFGPSQQRGRNDRKHESADHSVALLKCQTLSMKADYSEHASEILHGLSPNVRNAFFKQVRFLEQNLKHPSLHAKKYDESQDLWQARVNKDWRFYFQILDDIYYIVTIIPHPK